MIYTDGIHMISSTSLEELHQFATNQLGLPHRWFHPSPNHPHYDLLTKESLQAAIENGAKRVRPREIVQIIRANPNLHLKTPFNQEG